MRRLLVIYPSLNTYQLRIPRHRVSCNRSGQTGKYVVATSKFQGFVTRSGGNANASLRFCGLRAQLHQRWKKGGGKNLVRMEINFYFAPTILQIAEFETSVIIRLQ